MRTVIVVPYAIKKSGVVVFASRLKGALNSLGHQTILLMNELNNQKIKELEIIYKSFAELSEWLDKNIEEYDIVIWAGIYLKKKDVGLQISLSLKLREKYDKKILFFWEQTGNENPIANSTLFTTLTERGCDGFIALNDRHVKLLTDRHVSLSRILLLPPGVDTKYEFFPTRIVEEKNKIRSRLNLPVNTTIILSTSRFTYRKQIDKAVKAWINDAFLPDHSAFVLVGSGFGQNDSVEKEINQLAVMNKGIFIIQHQNEVSRAPFYQCADIFVAAGILEGEPSVLSEAMACGLPVVASDIPGHTALVVDQETGLLFAPDNFAQFKIALRRLITEEGFRKTLGDNARNFSVKKREIMSTANKLIEFVININQG